MATDEPKGSETISGSAPKKHSVSRIRSVTADLTGSFFARQQTGVQPSLISFTPSRPVACEGDAGGAGRERRRQVVMFPVRPAREPVPVAVPSREQRMASGTGGASSARDAERCFVTQGGATCEQ